MTPRFDSERKGVPGDNAGLGDAKRTSDALGCPRSIARFRSGTVTAAEVAPKKIRPLAMPAV